MADKVGKGKRGKGAQGKKAAESRESSAKKRTDAAPPAPVESDAVEAALAVKDGAPLSRVEQIKQSHALLRQFTSKELKLLMNLKRNTSPKAWTLREDLVVLTLPLSNREIAEILQDRNKEAVKKRLQLLRSKGLVKRQRKA